MSIRSLGTWTTTMLAVASLAAGCGDDSGGSSVGGSFDSITSAIDSPTGTVDADTAPAVATKFEEYQSSGAASIAPATALGASPATHKQSADIGAQLCTGGGSASFNAGGSQEAPVVEYDFTGCCITGSSCCLDGYENIYTSGSGTSTCYDFNLNYDCSAAGEDNTKVVFSGCQTADGLVYVIEIEGSTFAVSGSYSDGNGTLNIKGENGEFTCTWTDGSGSCEGDGGSFDV